MVEDRRSIASMIPMRVTISALNLMVFGMVIVVVVCRADSFVIVPIKIDPNVRRIIGLVGALVS